eukprot:CAMPEP_0119011166 /NCGR_PEP_ID=MMETSP1176-20130426/5493_1 /TAXON_ID=265551 /ORGANISM="Synedropsis recta cf, Strain CCMP1620" /LENGTH=394 /DNA_ID=CAMNT_0006963943 /DNA_START=95 /DNA_END=1279 /DNA_ORIENTATION=+
MKPSIHKERIGLRVLEGLRVKKPQSRPGNLKDLMDHHLFLSSQLHELVDLLKAQLKHMEKHNTSRLQVIRQVVAMSEGTPIAGVVVSPLRGERGGNEEEDDNYTDDDDSLDEADDTLESIYKELHFSSFDAQGKSLNDICLRAEEWDTTVSKRVQKSRIRCESLRRDLDHYVKKVDDLTANINRSESQRKLLADAVYERKTRNDEKLVKARQEYGTNINELCLYLKEVTEHGWKDLVPMILRIVNLDITATREQEEITAKLGGVVEDLKDIAEKNDFNADEDRIEALKADPPSMFASPEKCSISRPTSHTEQDDDDEPYIPFSPPFSEPRPTPSTPADGPIPTAPLAQLVRPGTPESIYTDGDPEERFCPLPSAPLDQLVPGSIYTADDPEERF